VSDRNDIEPIANQLPVALFENHASTGIYKLDEADVLTQANLAFATLQGYEAVEDIRGISVRTMFANPSDADWIRQRLIAQQTLLQQQVVMRRRNGETYRASLTAVPFLGANQEYLGCGGLLEDTGKEEEYERLFNAIPVGFYRIENRAAKEIVVDCNDEFARINGLATRRDMIGRDIRDFHYSPEETAHFMDRIAEAASTGGSVLGAQLRIRTASGAVKTLEVNSRPQFENGLILGRTGAVRDITAEVEMREMISLLTSDIGTTLHAFRHTLTQLKYSLGAIGDILMGAPNSRHSATTPQELEQQVRGPLRELSSGINGLLAAIASVSHAEALHESDRERLVYLRDAMEKYKDRIPDAHWRDYWRSGAIEIIAICERLRPSTVARATYRHVIETAKRIATITGLATLSVAREAVEAIEAPVRSLYELVAFGFRPVAQREVVAIESCVIDAIANLTGFADERKVSIEFNRRSPKEVLISRVDVTRAISNLLHNAIKYSWTRDRARTRVNVSIDDSDAARVVVRVENWGTPIPQEELMRGLLFRVGFRGRFSSDRGRMGTGVGLADALRIARAHNGDIRVESRPASRTGDPTQYDQPFITTVCLELPRPTTDV